MTSMPDPSPASCHAPDECFGATCIRPVGHVEDHAFDFMDVPPPPDPSPMPPRFHLFGAPQRKAQR